MAAKKSSRINDTEEPVNISVAREEEEDENRPNEDTGPQLLQLQPPLLPFLPAPPQKNPRVDNLMRSIQRKSKQVENLSEQVENLKNETKSLKKEKRTAERESKKLNKELERSKETATKKEMASDAKVDQHVQRNASLKGRHGESRENFLQKINKLEAKNKSLKAKIEELKVEKEKEVEKKERYWKAKLEGIQRRHDKQILNKDDKMKKIVRKLELELECVVLEQNEKIQDAIDNEKERACEKLKTEWKKWSNAIDKLKDKLMQNQQQHSTSMKNIIDDLLKERRRADKAQSQSNTAQRKAEIEKEYADVRLEKLKVVESSLANVKDAFVEVNNELKETQDQEINILPLPVIKRTCKVGSKHPSWSHDIVQLIVELLVHGTPPSSIPGTFLYPLSRFYLLPSKSSSFQVFGSYVASKLLCSAL